jgi:hypothetical protein
MGFEPNRVLYTGAGSEGEAMTLFTPGVVGRGVLGVLLAMPSAVSRVAIQPLLGLHGTSRKVAGMLLEPRGLIRRMPRFLAVGFRAGDLASL